jgi:phosphoglycolate phosphatase
MSGVRLDGVIFDLDGTLVNSLRDIATSVNLTRRDYGLAPLPGPAVTRHVGEGSAALVHAAVPVPPERFAEALARYLDHYARHVLDTTCLFPGIDRLLRRLAERPLAVVTNKTEALALAILSGLGVRSRFDPVLGGETLPEKKPHPRPILHVLERWGLPPARAGLVGDGIHDMAAGRAAGVVTIGVGYGVAGRAALAAEHPAYLVDTVADLDRLLL